MWKTLQGHPVWVLVDLAGQSSDMSPPIPVTPETGSIEP